MMGFAQPSMRVCTTKGSSSLLFLTEQDVENKPRTQCINCAGCAKVCPMHLMPMKIEAAVLSGDWEDAKNTACLTASNAVAALITVLRNARSLRQSVLARKP